MGFGSWLSDTASDIVSSAADVVSDVASHAGDAVGAGTFDSVGGFFDSVKEAAGGDLGAVFDQVTEAVGGGTEGFFGAVTDRLDDLGGIGGIGEQVSQVVSGFTDSGSGGGWSGALGDLIGQTGDDAGGFSELAGGFGKLLGGDSGGFGLSDLVPSSISGAISEGLDLPFVSEGLDAVSWQDVAGSLPGLGGAISSLGMGADGIVDHIQDVVTQVVDNGSVWSLGTAIADAGPAFLGQIAEFTEPDDIWTFLPAVAEQAGVELPGWAGGLATDPLEALSGEWDSLPGGGAMPAGTDLPDPLAADPEVGGDVGQETAGGYPGVDDPGVDDPGLDDPGLDDEFPESSSPDVDLDASSPEHDPTFDVAPPEPAFEPEPEPAFEPEPEPEAPAPEPASAQIESDFDAIGDDAFGDL